MFKNFQVTPPIKLTQRDIDNRKVRSPKFMIKSTDNVPKVNHKAVPLHFLYEYISKIEQKDTCQPSNLQFWACATPEIIRHQANQTQKTCLKRKTSFSPSEHLLKKYLSRRASLTVTKRRGINTEQNQRREVSVTASQRKSQELLSSTKSFKINPPRDNLGNRKSLKTRASSCSTVQQQCFEFNNKILEQLALSETPFYNQRTQRLRFAAEKRIRRF